MKKSMRESIWEWLCRNIEPGTLLPWWAIAARAVIFPLDTLFWQMSKTRGYQFRENVWLIGGVKYSDQMFRALSRANGELFRAERTGDVVQFTHIGVTAVPITAPAARWYQF
jgi:hypothetical protein